MAQPKTFTLPPILQKYLVGVNPAILLGAAFALLLVIAGGAFFLIRKLRKKERVTAAGFTALPGGAGGAGGLADIHQKIAQTAAERERRQ